MGRIAAAAALVGTAVLSVPIVHAEEFRLLEIDGQHVSWRPVSGAGPIVLSYAFAAGPTGGDDNRNCGPITAVDALANASKLSSAAVTAAAQRAFARWQHVAGVVFRPAADAAHAEIVIGAQTAPTGIAYTDLALAPRPAGADRAIVGAVICLNPDRHWKIGFDGNLTTFDLEHVLAHEIGHVLGLDHPDGHGHVMSFRYLETSTALTPGDAEGAVALYGPAATPGGQAVAGGPAVAPVTTGSLQSTQ